MTIALIAHDNKKADIIALVMSNKTLLEKHTLVATGTTGKLISDRTGLEVIKMMSGPLGGDQQIGAMVAEEKVDLIIFLRDPLTAQPHEPDVSALLRICDVHNTPLATNLSSATIMLRSLESL